MQSKRSCRNECVNILFGITFALFYIYVNFCFIMDITYNLFTVIIFNNYNLAVITYNLTMY